MPADLDEFIDEIEDLTSQVSRARYQDFAAVLRRWFAAFEEAPSSVKARFHWLLTLHPWSEYGPKVLSTRRGSAIVWPEEREGRLSAQLNLFKEFATEHINAYQFSYGVFGSSSGNINEALHRMTEHLFEPLASDLKRYLVRNKDNPSPGGEANQPDTDVPASDRIVSVDHNSEAYTHALVAIEEAKSALAESNIVEPGDRDRIRFELDSGALLLHAPAIRISAVKAVLIAGLTWLVLHFADAALGIAAEKAITAVSVLLGLPLI